MTTGSKTTDAYHPWTTYIGAREEARRRGDRRVGTDHLVLALLHDPAMESLIGVTVDRARDALDTLDREALYALGIEASLDAPPLPMRPTPARPTLKAVLTDRLQMTPAAKAVLEEAAKPMRRRLRITPPDLLRTLLELRSPDPAAALLAALGVDTAALRVRLETQAPAA